MGNHRFVIEGKEYQVDVGTRLGSNVAVTVNGKAYDVEVTGQGSPSAPSGTGPAAPRPAAAPVVTAAAATPVPGAGGAGEVRAPIPGVVLSVDVAEGDQVTASMKILVLEAMKMENEIFAGVDGVVAKIHVKPQQEARQGDLLVTITPN